MEPLAIKLLEGGFIGEEPSFHHLNHQMHLLVGSIIRCGPLIVPTEERPRSFSVCHRAFAVYDKQTEVVRIFVNRCANRSNACLRPPQAMILGMVIGGMTFRRNSEKP